MTTSLTNEAQRLILVGSGPSDLWEPTLAALAQRYELALIDTDYPTWQGAYAPTHRIADITNAFVLFKSVADLRGEVATAAVLTWHPGAVEPLAGVCAKLRLRFPTLAAVRASRDNADVRMAAATGNLPEIPWRLAHDEEDVVAASESIGCPVVLRPRRRGRAEARLCADQTDLREAFAHLVAGSSAGAIAEEGVIVERYVDGPQLAVASTVWAGKSTPVAVGHPVFAGDRSLVVNGYTVEQWREQEWSTGVANAVQAVHENLSIDWGVTTTRIVVGADGPHVIAVDTWLDGVLVREAAAAGVDLVDAAAAIAFERQPIPM